MPFLRQASQHVTSFHGLICYEATACPLPACLMRDHLRAESAAWRRGQMMSISDATCMDAHTRQGVRAPQKAKRRRQMPRPECDATSTLVDRHTAADDKAEGYDDDTRSCSGKLRLRRWFAEYLGRSGISSSNSSSRLQEHHIFTNATACFLPCPGASRNMYAP